MATTIAGFSVATLAATPALALLPISGFTQSADHPKTTSGELSFNMFNTGRDIY